MVDTMFLLGIAAGVKLAGDRLVRDVVSYVIGNPTYLSFPRDQSLLRHRPRRRLRKEKLSRSMKSNTSGLGRRPSSNRRRRKIHAMSDDELEAELEHRRRRRAKEREMFARAMRSDKLASLESELESLRNEIGRIDGPRPSVRFEGSGTPANSRWEALPRHRGMAKDSGKSIPETIGDRKHAVASINIPSVQTKIPASPGGPPPPPPPPPLRSASGEEGDDLVIDPEKQKREKLERQKRREAKKKEREQTQKKLTLADIIRSAGADPAKRLKPASKKPADLEKEEWERAKREREEREKQEEKERIEQERLAKEGTPSKAAANSVEKNEGGSTENHPADSPKLGQRDKGKSDTIAKGNMTNTNKSKEGTKEIDGTETENKGKNKDGNKENEVCNDEVHGTTNKE